MAANGMVAYAERRARLCVPSSPRLLVANPDRWKDLDAGRRADFGTGEFHAAADSDILIDLIPGHEMQGLGISAPAAQTQLDHMGVVYSVAESRWVATHNGSSRLSPVDDIGTHYLVRALIAQAAYDRTPPPFFDTGIAVAAALDDVVMEEVDDPASYLHQNGRAISVVVGVEPDSCGSRPGDESRVHLKRHEPEPGTIRIDTADPEAVAHYFELKFSLV